MINKKTSIKSLSIYIKSVIALLLINFIHKIVREIPGTFINPTIPGQIITISMAMILAVSITLLILKKKVGLYMGLIPAIWQPFQCLTWHVILGNPDINGVWWYPIFPMVQSFLIIYFTYLAWKNEVQ